MASNTYTCPAEVALHCIPLHYPVCQRNTIPRARGKPHTASTVCYCWHPELARLLQLNSSSKRFPAQCSLSRLRHWEEQSTHKRQREIMLWVVQEQIDREENIPQGNTKEKENFIQRKRIISDLLLVKYEVKLEGKLEFKLAAEWSCRCHNFLNTSFHSQFQQKEIIVL